MACHCCGKGGPSIALLILLEDLREHFGRPVTLNCVARCLAHNANTPNSAKRSEHIVTPENNWESDGADIKVKGVTPTKVYGYLKSRPYANLIGLGKYKGFTHVDTRGYGARWAG